MALGRKQSAPLLGKIIDATSALESKSEPDSHAASENTSQLQKSAEPLVAASDEDDCPCNTSQLPVDSQEHKPEQAPSPLSSEEEDYPCDTSHLSSSPHK